ncbi:MAG TPA: barstar family protein [Chitinophagaceae bacterium]|nr:barstar family protein [Chitinophagaceae bacterium]
MAKIYTHSIPFHVSHRTDRYIACLDGRHIQSMDDFYDQLQDALSLPDYFGRNLDALFDILSDLSWIEQQFTFLIITNLHEMFAQDSAKRDALLQLLFEVENVDLEIFLFD